MNEELVEYFDVFDKNHNKTGKIVTRNERYNLSNDEYLVFVQVWILNKDGKYLLQKRANTKVSPNLWCTTGGHVRSNETSLECAIRETNEEIGLDISKLEGGLFDSRFYFMKNQNYFCDSYIFYSDVKTSDLIIQKEEVERVEYMTIDELIKLMNDGKSFTYWIDYLDILKKKANT